MGIDACAALVQRGDRDRFLSAMTAPPDARAPLLVLYAFNLEIARAPWATVEPVMAEMRLQWWADTIKGMAEGQTPPAHEVAGPLGEVMRAHALPVAPLLAMIAARRFDIDTAPQPDGPALDLYIDATAGELMWLAALTLGTPQSAEPALRDFAHGSGVAALLLAAPALKAAGRPAFADDSDKAIGTLAGRALARLKRARAANNRIPPTIAPALRAGWMAAPVLRRARHRPARVMSGNLAFPEFHKRLRLMRQTALARW